MSVTSCHCVFCDMGLYNLPVYCINPIKSPKHFMKGGGGKGRPLFRA